jgi:NAD(P)H-hydrate epimerase
MIPLLSADNTRILDQRTISQNIRSEAELMDAAGRSVAHHILENISYIFKQELVIVCGNGNNGGDGLICHAYLKKYGLDSKIYTPIGIDGHEWIFDKYQIQTDDIKSELPAYADIVVDALFGTGLSRDVSWDLETVVHWINDQPYIVSIDIPSGIHTDNGRIMNCAVLADETIAMGTVKLGHVLDTGKENTGDLTVMDIGFPTIKANEISAQLVQDIDISEKIIPFDENAHKYSRGKALLICGSQKYPGAAILAAQSVARSGAGIIKLAADDSIKSILEASLHETIIVEDINDDLLIWPDAILIGPGLGIDDESIKNTAGLLGKIKRPCIVDASAFLPVIHGIMNITDLPETCILTPHYGEFTKLFNISLDDLKNDPVGSCSTVTNMLNGRTLVLKGPATLIIDPQGNILLDHSGDPILATAGTGDVLAGIISGFLVQGYTPLDAVLCGVRIHGESAQLFMEEYGNFGLMAKDLIYRIPNAITYFVQC